jgi:hypothetical protein
LQFENIDIESPHSASTVLLKCVFQSVLAKNNTVGYHYDSLPDMAGHTLYLKGRGNTAHRFGFENAFGHCLLTN